jgi:hypothetical protein
MWNKPEYVDRKRISRKNEIFPAIFHQVGEAKLPPKSFERILKENPRRTFRRTGRSGFSKVFLKPPKAINERNAI